MKNYKIRILLKRQFFGWLVCLLFLLGCEAETNSPQWITVEHKQYHFSIEYPTKWRTDLYGESGYKGNEEIKLVIGRQVSIFGQSSVPSFSILIKQRVLNNPSLEDALLWGYESVDRNLLNSEPFLAKSGYEELLFQEEEIAGFPAARHRYTYFDLNGILREEIYIPREDDMLIISYAVNKDYFDDFYPDFERIVNSFKTIPSN